MRRVLVMAANPKGTSRLRLDREMRDLEEALRLSPAGDRFELHQRLALRPRDLQRALLEVKPEIVHFCGHGEGQAGLVLEGVSGQPQWVSTGALAELFGLVADSVKCVLLNVCYAEVQADAIVESIDYVIGMRRAVPDDVAIAFATGFYGGLGNGLTIEKAFEKGCEVIHEKQIIKSENVRKASVVGFVDSVQQVLSVDEIPVLKKR